MNRKKLKTTNQIPNSLLTQKHTATRPPAGVMNRLVRILSAAFALKHLPAISINHPTTCLPAGVIQNHL